MNTRTLSHFQNGGRYKRALFFLLALMASLGSAQAVWAAAGTNFSFVTLRARTTTTGPTTTTYYGTDSDPASGNQPFDPRSNSTSNTTINDLGMFDLNSGELVISAAQFNVFTTSSGSSTVTSGQLFYRAYLVGATDLPAFTAINLSTVTSSGPSSFRITDFSTTNSTNNVLAGLLSGGTYEFEIFFRANGSGSGVPVIDQNNQTTPPTPYRARFRVMPPAVTPAGAVTIWNGSVNTEWTNPANWSNGVPNALADAVIPFERNQFTDANQIPRFPTLNNIAETYAVRNLTVRAVSFTNRGLIRVTNAVLRIYGDLDNGANGILATADRIPGDGGTVFQSATISFEGGDQRINRGRFANVIIAGTGIKSLTGVLEVPGGTIRFRPTNPTEGVLLRTTAFDEQGRAFVSTLGDQVVDLGDNGTISLLPGEAETNTSFILGLTKSFGTPVAGEPETFGNIGLTVTTGANGAGRFSVTRATGPFFIGPVGSGARSVKRSFGVSVGDPNVNINATLSFRYNDSNTATGGLSINELNGNDEPDLRIFRTLDSGANFQNLGGIPDVTNNVVTTTGVRSINTVTLGDRDTPLPVSLVSFQAVRSGNNAALTWTTVAELNNKGFEVQVSTNGRDFRTLTFINSQAPNGTANGQFTYRYVDAEAGKQDNRYYRLRQVDLDGKQAFYGPRVVNFAGNIAEDAGLVAYPNPFDSELNISVQNSTAGDVRVLVSDMTGRTLTQQLLTLPRGTSTFALDGVQGLKSGTYFVRVITATGKEQTVRVSKR